MGNFEALDSGLRIHYAILAMNAKTESPYKQQAVKINEPVAMTCINGPHGIILIFIKYTPC